jgi:hypothetical protein
MENSQVDQVINEFKKTRLIPSRTTRYPKLKLHPQFEDALRQQILLLKKEGLDDKVIESRLVRALPFYIYES